MAEITLIMGITESKKWMGLFTFVHFYTSTPLSAAIKALQQKIQK